MEPKISATGHRLLVRFDQVAGVIEYANHSVM
jgi:hypothetical protein